MHAARKTPFYKSVERMRLRKAPSVKAQMKCKRRQLFVAVIGGKHVMNIPFLEIENFLTVYPVLILCLTVLL